MLSVVITPAEICIRPDHMTFMCFIKTDSNLFNEHKVDQRPAQVTRFKPVKVSLRSVRTDPNKGTSVHKQVSVLR